MKKIICLSLLLSIILFASAQKNVLQFVNPMIGTQRMGHTFPGAVAPFGMVQLSPDTDTIPYEVNGKYNPDVYKYCAGYQYDDKTIVGFSHTHFSGTGHSDLGDLLLMPTMGALQLNPGIASNPKGGYRSAFSHSNEVSEAGYYKVLLDDDNITAELTATTRVGIHKYQFPAAGDAHVVLDLMSGIYNYDSKNVWTFLRVENDSTLTGYRQTTGWGRTRTVYFAIAFSKKFSSYGTKKYDDRQEYRGFWGKFDQENNFPEAAGRKIKFYANFKLDAAADVMVKVAISPVSSQNAMQNMQAEAAGWNFETYKQNTQAAWSRELSKIKIEADTETLTNFYTGMYHAFIAPSVYADTDGRYRGLDQEIHSGSMFTNYSTFSLWDTYRALHPFFSIVQPARNDDMIKSMLAHYDQSVHNMLPVWSHYANENWCMSGYHSVSVVCDAIVKGNTGFNAEAALDACIQTSMHRNFDGLGKYIDMGYVPAEISGNSVSTTLEYAYDDWCIAQAAKKLGRTNVYNEYIQRAGNYKNVWDASIGFMRPRLANGNFRKEFDVLSTHGQGFIEGNAWNYSLFVPHQPQQLIQLMGGNKKFIAHLDSLFNMELPDAFFKETEDITRDGIIGNYVHGNEPSHHVAYLYNFTNEPYKTQERIRMILPKMYKPTPDGLGGNDDCGQMSAWYMFSALGFYPVAPASGEYALGSPVIQRATIKLDNGKTFIISVTNQAPGNVYVSKASLNGQKLIRPFISHQDIMQGGVLEFEMSSKPVKAYR